MMRLKCVQEAIDQRADERPSSSRMTYGDFSYTHFN